MEERLRPSRVDVYGEALGVGARNYRTPQLFPVIAGHYSATPRAFAVMRLIVRSNLVGACTGRAIKVGATRLSRRHDMGLLDGDSALVTGAASGIGRGIARTLAEEGARLVLSDVAVEPGKALARELDATFITADLAEPTAARPLFDAARSALGHISNSRTQRFAQAF
jgi:hypothetical protein